MEHLPIKCTQTHTHTRIGTSYTAPWCSIPTVIFLSVFLNNTPVYMLLMHLHVWALLWTMGRQKGTLVCCYCRLGWMEVLRLTEQLPLHLDPPSSAVHPSSRQSIHHSSLLSSLLLHKQRLCKRYRGVQTLKANGMKRLYSAVSAMRGLQMAAVVNWY